MIYVLDCMWSYCNWNFDNIFLARSCFRSSRTHIHCCSRFDPFHFPNQVWFFTYVLRVSNIFWKNDEGENVSLCYSLFCGLMVLMLGGFMAAFVSPSSSFQLVFAIGGAILFSLFVIVDTQLMMHHLSPEEYITATIQLYLDFINLFLYILRALQYTNQ